MGDLKQKTSQKSSGRGQASAGRLALFAVGCLILLYACTLFGISNIPFKEANRILVKELTGITIGSKPFEAGQLAIIWDVRLPRVILAFLTGGALAMCGAAFQGIFKNPMADPYILGVSSGAALGASIGIILHLNQTWAGLGSTAAMAFAGALVTIWLVYEISRVGRRIPVTNLLLSGVAIGQTLSAVMSLLMLFNIQNMNQILFWTMGSFNGSGWKHVVIVLPFVIAGCVILFASVRELDIMLLGEETATQLGVDSERLKRRVLISSSLIVAAVVSVTGVIGFVGLIVPHIVRLITGPKHRVVLPFSLIFGGVFLVVCDTLARSVSKTEIPVGIITAVFGGPFFIFLLRRQRKGGM